MTNKKTMIVSMALALSAGIANAEGLYTSLMLGASVQANGSEPYGNNIAADPDFPSEFDFETGGIASVGIGYDFNNQFRVEGRLGYHKSNFDDTQYGTGARDGEEYVLNGEFESTTVTLEGFYDIKTQSSITPYLKAGAGISSNKYSARLGGAGVAAFDAFDGTTDGYYDAYADGTSTNFTWNVGFGATMPINDTLSLVGEYQYASFGSVETGQDSFTDGFSVDGAAHEVMIGLRANF